MKPSRGVSAGCETRSRLSPRFRQCENIIVAIFLFAGIFTFPEYPDTSLDPSWRIALSYAFYHGLKFGHDIVFTYGPLGFLMGNTYDGTHFWGLVAWQFFKGVAFTAVILRGAKLLPLAVRWCYFAMFLLFGYYFEDTLHLSIILLVGLWCVQETEPPKPQTCCLIGLGLAWLSAIKFTNLLLVSVTVVIAAIVCFRQARSTNAKALSLSYIGGFLLIWLMARQSVTHLPEYFVNSWQISRGYEESMGLQPPRPALLKALGGIALLCCYLGFHLVFTKNRIRAMAEVSLITAFGFLIWKHGFVRADGHMGGFFSGMMLPAIVAPTLLDKERRLNAVKWGGAMLIVAMSLWGLDDSFTITRWNAWDVFREKMSNHVDRIRHWDAFRASYEHELQRVLKASPLDKTRSIVGDASIDVLGYDCGIVCLHGLNYRPRPVFQSYSAYNPALERLNYNHLASPAAARFILQKLQTIDERFLSLDDGLALRLLPRLYEFVLIEDGYVLWRRRPPLKTDSEMTPEILLAGEHELGEPLLVEDFGAQPLWLELDQPLSLAGQLRAALYQPPIVQLQLTDTSGRTTNFRLPLSQARAGFIVNPIIEDTADYLSFVSSESRRTLRSLTIIAGREDSHLFAPRFRYSLGKISLPRLEKSLTGEVRYARFHMFKTLPTSETAFTPFMEVEIEGHKAILAHAPSEMRFDLSAGASYLTGSFGFPQGAYLDGGGTDGATFQILWTDGQQRKTLLSRYLDPVHASADRGLQPFSIDLSSFHDGTLILETDAGPTGSNAWDWTAWTEIEIKERK